MIPNPVITCFWCGRRGNRYVLAIDDEGEEYIDAVRYSRDHIFPKYLGGCNHDQNICLSCISCNATKADRVVYPFPAHVADHVADCTHVRHNRKLKQLPREPVAEMDQVLVFLAMHDLLSDAAVHRFRKRLWRQPLDILDTLKGIDS